MKHNELETTKLLSETEMKKVLDEFSNDPDTIKGNSFDDLLDNIDAAGL